MFQKTIVASALALALSHAVLAQNHSATTDPSTAGTSVTDMPATEHQQTTVQETTTTGSQTSTDTSTQSESADMAAMEYDVRASDLLGMEIKNAQNEEIGEIDDLIITGKDKVLHAVVSVGGFLGMGDKRVAIPYDELQIDRQADLLEVVRADQPGCEYPAPGIDDAVDVSILHPCLQSTADAADAAFLDVQV